MNPGPAADGLVGLEVEGHLATLTLNRPQRHNALDQALADALLAAVRAVNAMAPVRCVLLRADGRSFGVGGDLATFADANTTAAQARQLLITLSGVVLGITGSDKLFVCAAQGAVAGGSLALALCCDFVIWGEDARLTPAYARLAATPDCGLSWTLTRALGPQRALQWLLDGSTWSGSRAAAAGLGCASAPTETLQAQARELALRLAGLDPGAVSGTKRLVESAGAQSLGPQLNDEMRRFLVCTQSDAFRRQVDGFRGAGSTR